MNLQRGFLRVFQMHSSSVTFRTAKFVYMCVCMCIYSIYIYIYICICMCNQYARSQRDEPLPVSVLLMEPVGASCPLSASATCSCSNAHCRVACTVLPYGHVSDTGGGGCQVTDLNKWARHDCSFVLSDACHAAAAAAAPICGLRVASLSVCIKQPSRLLSPRRLVGDATVTCLLSL